MRYTIATYLVEHIQDTYSSKALAMPLSWLLSNAMTVSFGYVLLLYAYFAVPMIDGLAL